jgi:alkane 1-monooxygenase
MQFVTLFGLIWLTSQAEYLSALEKFGVFFGVGVITGTVGINYSHELMHQKSRGERLLADLLLAMVLYSHFRSEHLLVHHRYVGTPRDPVTARYNEGFHRFYPRVLIGCLRSAFRAERELLARKDKPWSDTSNPFFRYWALQLGMLVLAFLLGGLGGVVLFIVQAGVAIWQLELVNYVEHYGLTRKHLGDGKYEHVLPRHSWNAAHKASNWLLINLQRHSDHHYKPDRRFPLLQNYTEHDAPQLPFGYPIMTVAALIPPLWRRVMNPRVREWRRVNYPEITDWTPYNKALNPEPGTR